MTSTVESRFALLERSLADLSALHTAATRLHESVRLDHVITAIREVLADLLGSEQSAIYEAGSNGTVLTLIASKGIDPHDVRVLRVGEGSLGGMASEAAPYVRPADAGPPGELEPTAFLPLRVEGQLVGAVAVFHLLPQKSELLPVDFRLLEVLSIHAATALYCAFLHAGRPRIPAAPA